MFLWSIILANWCMILENGVIENALYIVFITFKCEYKSNIKKVPVDYYFSDMVHDPVQQGH